MRHKPKYSFSGLTIVVSNPSRNDHTELLCGYPGTILAENFRPHFNRYQCDIRTADTLSEGLLPNTKALLLLGERSMHMWTGGRYNNYTIHEQRGCPLQNDWKLPCIASYFPQDCLDFQDYEGRLNPQSERFATDEEGEDETKEDDYEGQKRKGKTARTNWRFWLEKDLQKFASLFPSWRIPDSPLVEYNIHPTSTELIPLLYETQNKELFIDIETDDLLQIRCIGISFGLPIVYVVPLFRYDYTATYSVLAKILAGLTIALNRNQVVVHHSMFDLFVLAYRYGITFGRDIYDTMLAWHRCYPEVEKSLGHCVSVCTWEPYHKDEILYNPKNTEQDWQLWKYNGKDIYTMILIKRWIDARKDFGLQDSIRQCNNSIRPFLINTMHGLRFNDNAKKQIMFDNDRKMEQLLRIINIFTGGHRLLPTSSKSCANYFHSLLGYKSVARTKSGASPSLDEKAMWKLKLKYPDNACINLCLEYRRLSKETGSMKFIPFDFSNKLLSSQIPSEEEE